MSTNNENRRSRPRRDTRDQRLTRAEKEAHSKAWYKDQIDKYDAISFGSQETNAFGFSNSHGGLLFQDSKTSHYQRMKINYDLFNNVINLGDFNYVIKPFGEDFGDLPANLTNKDIVSGKIKALIGLESKRPFEWRVLAVNEEATSRKEAELFNGVRDYVTNSIIEPIRVQLEQQALQESQGRELNEDEKAKLQQQIAEQLKTKTPPEVKKYMLRDHQDPAEVLANQLLEYIIQKEEFKQKADKIWKHGLISGVEVGWTGIVAGEPVLRVINPLRFDFDKSPDTDYIQDGEWAGTELIMTPSEIVSSFGEELENADIDKLYTSSLLDGVQNANFTFDGNNTDPNNHTIPVVHFEWKSLKQLKFLTYRDLETGNLEETIVDESYVLNEEAGDIELVSRWIPHKYEGYKIKVSDPIYVSLREVPGQYKDLDNLTHCKLSYIGAVYDNMNSQITSVMDRMKYYQYYYNIIMYRIELLMASDQGKKIFLNLRAIPKTQGINMKQFMYHLKSNDIGLLDPTEEGKKMGADVTNAVKEVDMSLISDIKNYIELSEYIKRVCGAAVGIPEELEGQISADQSVSNTNNTILQSSNVIEPLFELHNNVKRHLLQALIETAKVAYSAYPKKKLAYILDDMSLQMLTIDSELLENSTFGLFATNSSKSAQALEMVRNLSHAAMQNQKAELSDIIKVYKANNLQEAEEQLLVAEQNRIEREQAMQQREIESREAAEEKGRAFIREQHTMELEKIDKEFDRKEDLEIVKQTILSMGFNEDKDMDKDGTPDILEVAKHGLDADIKMRKQATDEAKLQHTINKDAAQLEQNEEKLKIEKQKIHLKNNPNK